MTTSTQEPARETAGASVRTSVRWPRPVAFVGVAVALAGFFIAAGAPTPLLPIYENEWRFAPWLLTLAFGVYALSLLGSLLIVGSLSDHVGRRPVLVGALALELISMVVFLQSASIGWVIVARVIQGVATGAATSAFSASLLELAPAHLTARATVISSLAPAGGLGLGALLAGTIAQFDAQASATIWTILVVVMALGTAFAFFVPETSSRRQGALASLAPRISVPVELRSDFAAAVPIQIAAWMMAALFMGLMPTILGSVFDQHGTFASGATAFIEPAAAALTTVVAAKIAARRILLAGSLAVALGAGLVITGIDIRVLPLIWLGGIVGGVGFGASFSGTVRLLAPRVAPHQRAGLFAAIYFVAYLAFGGPAIIAGLFLASLGVTVIAVAFGLVIAAAAALGVAGQLRALRRDARRAA